MTAPEQPVAPEIRTEYIRLSSAAFDLNESFDPKATAKRDVVFAFDIQRSFPTKQALEVQLSVFLFPETEDAPFTLDVTYQARFSVAAEEGVDLLRKFGQYNAFGMIMPYVRELITTVSARSGLAALVMPPVNIQRLIDGIESARKTDEKGPHSPTRFG